tara:strand:+ start:218 stop:523 length:306 start_codon:yes stop_codon:yes gene_type:complete
MKNKITTEEKIIRRETNRRHAQKSRLKKRLLLETLDIKIQEVEKENTALRQIIQDNIPEKAKEILEHINHETEMSLLCATDVLFDTIDCEDLHVSSSINNS